MYTLSNLIKAIPFCILFSQIALTSSIELPVANKDCLYVD